MSIAALIALITGAAVLTVEEVFKGWMRSGLHRLTQMIRSNPWARGADDHVTIHSGWTRVDGGGWPNVHAHVRCAPSRQWTRRQRVRLEGVYRFVHRVRPGQFPHEADYSVPDELIRFMTADTAPTDPSIACCTPNDLLDEQDGRVGKQWDR